MILITALNWVRYMEKDKAQAFLVGIDTNVLLRYICQDDETQSPIASMFLENLTETHQGFISNIVVVELIWVLSRTYKQSRQAIVGVLAELFSMPVFVFEDRTLLLKVLDAYRQSKADFSDLLIHAIAEKNTCQCTLTFDKVAYTQAGMRSLSDWLLPNND